MNKEHNSIYDSISACDNGQHDWPDAPVPVKLPKVTGGWTDTIEMWECKACGLIQFYAAGGKPR